MSPQLKANRPTCLWTLCKNKKSLIKRTNMNLLDLLGCVKYVTKLIILLHQVVFFVSKSISEYYWLWDIQTLFFLHTAHEILFIKGTAFFLMEQLNDPIEKMKFSTFKEFEEFVFKVLECHLLSLNWKQLIRRLL